MSLPLPRVAMSPRKRRAWGQCRKKSFSARMFLLRNVWKPVGAPNQVVAQLVQLPAAVTHNP
ncbi:hypothetical protein ACMHYB_25825 [Sorangium sp. So ce1128]